MRPLLKREGFKGNRRFLLPGPFFRFPFYMILVIRGHIRNSFVAVDLYHFVKQLYKIDPNLKIYIHTWTIFANNLSWRNIQINNSLTSKEIIYNYFDDLQHLIKEIIIDDDSKIQLIGNLEGYMNKRGVMPIRGWKNYWYGKYKIIEHIYTNTDNEKRNEMVINTRFDVFNNSNNFSEEIILNLIKNNLGTQFTKNKFIYDMEFKGVDNTYIGNIETMYKLTHYFHHSLDEILMENSDVYHHENLVYKINVIL